MQSRCCWPPESASADWRAAGPSPRPTARRACSELLDDLVELPLVAHPADAQAVGDVVEDRLRERIRFLEHHADAAAQLDDVDVARRRCPGRRSGSCPRPRASGMMSFIRLSERRNVDLPQPDGPDERGDTLRAGMSSEMSVQRFAWRRRRSRQSRTAILRCPSVPSSASAPAASRRFGSGVEHKRHHERFILSRRRTARRARIEQRQNRSSRARTRRPRPAGASPRTARSRR